MKKVMLFIGIVFVCSITGSVVADCTRHCKELEWSCRNGQVASFMEKWVPARAELIWSTTQTNSGLPDNMFTGQFNSKTLPLNSCPCSNMPVYDSTDGFLVYPITDPRTESYCQYCNYCLGGY